MGKTHELVSNFFPQKKLVELSDHFLRSLVFEVVKPHHLSKKLKHCLLFVNLGNVAFLKDFLSHLFSFFKTDACFFNGWKVSRSPIYGPFLETV